MEFLLGLTFTQWIIILSISLWLIYTMNAPKLGQISISETTKNWAWDMSFVPFCWGMTMTHWFMPRENVPAGWDLRYAAPVIAVLIAYDVFWKFSGKPRKHPVRYPLWYFIAGLPRRIPALGSTALNKKRGTA